jgi:hypothetical protein
VARSRSTIRLCSTIVNSGSVNVPALNTGTRARGSRAIRSKKAFW